MASIQGNHSFANNSIHSEALEQSSTSTEALRAKYKRLMDDAEARTSQHAQAEEACTQAEQEVLALFAAFVEKEPEAAAKAVNSARRQAALDRLAGAYANLRAAEREKADARYDVLRNVHEDVEKVGEKVKELFKMGGKR